MKIDTLERIKAYGIKDYTFYDNGEINTIIYNNEMEEIFNIYRVPISIIEMHDGIKVKYDIDQDNLILMITRFTNNGSEREYRVYNGSKLVSVVLTDAEDNKTDINYLYDTNENICKSICNNMHTIYKYDIDSNMIKYMNSDDVVMHDVITYILPGDIAIAKRIEQNKYYTNPVEITHVMK